MSNSNKDFSMAIKAFGNFKRKRVQIMSNPFRRQSRDEHEIGEEPETREKPDEYKYEAIKPEIVRRFKLGDSSIETLSFLPDGCAMALAEDQTLMQVQPSGKIKIKMDVRGVVMDMCAYDDNEILITHETHKCIYKQSIKSAQGTSCILKTKPLIPADTRPTPDKGFAVLAVDRWDYEISPRTKRQLRKYGSSGEMIKSVEFDEFGDRLFVQPGRVRVNPLTGDIAVCNFTDHEKDNVLVFNSDLELKFRTFGAKDVIPGKKRLPKNLKRNVVFNDLVFDDENNMVVVETKSQSVQLLSKNGVYLRTVYKDELEPRSISIDNEGYVWVGCYSGDVLVIKYKKKVNARTGEEVISEDKPTFITS